MSLGVELKVSPGLKKNELGVLGLCDLSDVVVSQCLGLQWSLLEDRCGSTIKYINPFHLITACDTRIENLATSL